MQTKTIDIVKAEPRTKLEAFERWMNHMQSKLLTTPISSGTKITVTQDSDITCTGHGRPECDRVGKHSWFHHATDSYYANADRELDKLHDVQSDVELAGEYGANSPKT
jgi:hypothetical protein